MDNEEREFVEQLFRQYKTALQRFAQSIIHDESTAEDIIQISFIEVMKHVKLLMNLPSHKAKSYLVNIVKSRALNCIVKEKNTEQLEEHMYNLTSKHPDDNIEEKVIWIMQYSECLEILQKVNERYRVVLQLKYLAPMTDREIAIAVGVSESSVRKYIQRALEEFRMLAVDRREYFEQTW